jgi:glutamyl-tRNA reductase
MVQASMAARGQRPLLFLDVSVPRNVDPAVGDIPAVHVHSLEHLTQLAEENRSQREAQVLEVDAIIEQELKTYKDIRTARDTTRLVAALHKRVEKVRQDHITRHGHHFDKTYRDHLDLFSSGLTRSVLHELVENLRSLNLETAEGRHRFQIAQELFNVTPDDGGD